MPLIEYIAPRSERRTLLMCALNDSVAPIAQKIHMVNPANFGLYIYRGSDYSEDLLLQTIQRQYVHVVLINTIRAADSAVYVEAPRLDVPLIAGLAGRTAIQICQKDWLPHIQINVSKATADQICVWLAPLLHDGAARL
jgi:hypothetical protein